MTTDNKPPSTAADPAAQSTTPRTTAAPAAPSVSPRTAAGPAASSVSLRTAAGPAASSVSLRTAAGPAASSVSLRTAAGPAARSTNSQGSKPLWSSRGYLPHFHGDNAIQAITYRLADSLPSQVLEDLKRELASLSAEHRDRRRRERIDAYLDAGHGSCVLADPECARIVIDNWQHFDGQRYRLLAWVVMPNHVHVLIQTIPAWPLDSILHSWKSYTSKRILALLENDRPAGRRRSRAGGPPALPGEPPALPGEPPALPGRPPGLPGRQAQQLWQREYWDRCVRDERHYAAVIDYIHHNPVKAGLVPTPEAWPFSSASGSAGDPPAAGPAGGPPASNPRTEHTPP